MDLTKITTPFGLLDDATREALEAHGGPYEWYCGGDWRDDEDPEYSFRAKDIVVRVKPLPPKPREWWVNLRNGVLIASSTCREDFPVKAAPGNELIHVREVLPD